LAPKKGSFTFHVELSVKERLKNAVYWLSGPPLRLNLSNFLTDVIDKAVRDLEEEHNHGKPFKKRLHEFVGGRPMK